VYPRGHDDLVHPIDYYQDDDDDYDWSYRSYYVPTHSDKFW
jgi:hypothetical protein